VARCPDREPDEDDGTYTLSVPNLPGSSVSGSSLSEAESALSVRIDTLV
jgi:predicted RNase H-like HicB family nuclease